MMQTLLFIAYGIYAAALFLCAAGLLCRWHTAVCCAASGACYAVFVCAALLCGKTLQTIVLFTLPLLLCSLGGWHQQPHHTEEQA